MGPYSDPEDTEFGHVAAASSHIGADMRHSATSHESTIAYDWINPHGCLVTRDSAIVDASFATSSSSHTSITTGSKALSYTSTSANSGASDSYASSLESYEQSPREDHAAHPVKCISRRNSLHKQHHPFQRNEPAADDYLHRPQHREIRQSSYTFEPLYSTRETPTSRPQYLDRPLDGRTAWPMEPPPLYESQPSWSHYPASRDPIYRNPFECREPDASTQGYAAPPNGVPPSRPPLQTYGRPSHRGGFTRSPYFSHF